MGCKKRKKKRAPQRKFKITCNNCKADLNDSQFKLASVTKCQFYSCETKQFDQCLSISNVWIESNTCVCLTSRPCWTGQRDRILKKGGWKFLERIRAPLQTVRRKGFFFTWNISCCWRWPRRAEGRCRVWSSWSKSGKPYFWHIWNTLSVYCRFGLDWWNLFIYCHHWCLPFSPLQDNETLI